MALLVGGDGARALVERLAERTGAKGVDSEFKIFPDGEDYARILGDVAGQSVTIVQTGYPIPRLWRLLMLLNAARENGAASIRCVVPYLPYARQDRRFLTGEAITSRLVAECIRHYADETVTVELHKDAVADYFGGTCRNLSAVEPFAKEFKARKVETVLAPDAGALDRARAVATRLGVAVDHLEKKRLSGEAVEIRPKTLDVRGRVVAILDDIISTGGTMAKATEHLVKQGASRVICAGVHGLFLGDAVSRLKTAGASEVLASDTIESPFSRVSIADEIAQALRVATPSAVRR